MKKSNYLFIFFLTGCFFQQNQKTILSQYFSGNSLKREIAGESKKQCFKQLFDVKNLRHEVSALEKKYERFEKVEGSWKHLDLKKLPVPQANFLLRFGDKFGKLPFEEDAYRDCEDLTCIINRVYGDRNELAGLVHYLWYLKFGNMLSFDNFIPKQKSKLPGIYSGKEISFQNYLFSDDELYAFWKLSSLLEDPFLSLEKLTEIQRIPSGEQFEQKIHQRFCGLSSPAGWITLTDQCLELQSEGEDGYLFSAVTHELAHHLDYELGNKYFNSSNRSLVPDYVDAAGFYLEEYLDDQQFVHRNWKLKENIRPVNNYASHSPQENFAEMVALFRFSGNELKDIISEEHFNFLKNKIFDGKEFLPQKYFDLVIKKRRGEIFKFALKSFSECQIDDGCFQSNLGRFTEELLGGIRREEPEGCSMTESTKSREDFKESVQTVFLEDMETIKSFDLKWEDYLKVKDFDLENKAILSYLNCYDEEKTKDCYENVNDQETLIIHRIFPFEEMELSMKRKYRDLVFGMNQEIYKSSKKIWDFCKIESSDNSEAYGVGAFVIADGYMKIAQYNCLNKSIDVSLDSIVSVLGEKIHPVEQKILKERILTTILTTFQNLYQSEKKGEFDSLKLFMPTANDSDLIKKNKCQKLKEASLKFSYHLWKDVLKKNPRCEDF